jgi:hypothetical protein
MPEIVTSPVLLILVGVLGYLLGSVPFGIVITRALGLGDLRAIGSGDAFAGCGQGRDCGLDRAVCRR